MGVGEDGDAGENRGAAEDRGGTRGAELLGVRRRPAKDAWASLRWAGQGRSGRAVHFARFPPAEQAQLSALGSATKAWTDRSVGRK
jgi:hypothetical protein